MRIKLFSLFVGFILLICYTSVVPSIATVEQPGEGFKLSIRGVLSTCHETYIDGFGNVHIIFNTEKAVDKLYSLFQKELEK